MEEISIEKRKTNKNSSSKKALELLDKNVRLCLLFYIVQFMNEL